MDDKRKAGLKDSIQVETKLTEESFRPVCDEDREDDLIKAVKGPAMNETDLEKLQPDILEDLE